jgi:hypothetical protein
MHILLILNTILELAVPTGMLVRPAFFYTKLEPANEPFARLFACALMGLGLTSLVLLINPSAGLQNGLISLAIFHGLIAIGQFNLWRRGSTQPFIFVVHTALCLAFISTVIF